MKQINLLTLCLCLSPLMVEATSLKPLPKESGFNGFILAGVNYTNFASNIVAGNSLTNISHDSNNGLFDNPSYESDISPVLTGEVNYTFASVGTQVYIGNELEDVVKYDLSTQLGIRQSLSYGGIGKVAVLTSGRLPTHVYSDPFNTDNADKTDRNTKGIRLGWDNMFNAGFSIELTRKEVDIDDENSGSDLLEQGLITEQEKQLLSREGTISNLKVSYLWVLSKNHIFEPELIYGDIDKDGQALANNRYGAGLTYLYTNEILMLVSQITYSYSEYDEISPVWNLSEVGDAGNIGASIVASYAKPFGWQDASLFGSIAYAAVDSNINFYDSDVLTMFVGVLWKI